MCIEHRRGVRVGLSDTLSGNWFIFRWCAIQQEEYQLPPTPAFTGTPLGSLVGLEHSGTCSVGPAVHPFPAMAGLDAKAR